MCIFGLVINKAYLPNLTPIVTGFESGDFSKMQLFDLIVFNGVPEYFFPFHKRRVKERGEKSRVFVKAPHDDSESGKIERE